MNSISQFLLFVFCFLLGFSCRNEKVTYSYDSQFQKELNSLFKDASKSPLKPKDLKNFQGLDFFPVDSNFVVQARLITTPNSSFFGMTTTTNRVSEERIYGEVLFYLSGKSYRLNVYQSKDSFLNNDDYLFLPFSDNTNGVSTYGGGRYLDLQIPESDTLWLDFNKAYNPYCAYNEKYSCPIVPPINTLDCAIQAGVKQFKH